MDLFEKIHNYQIQQELFTSGIFPVTKAEKSWLKMYLVKEQDNLFLSPKTRKKLEMLLDKMPTFCTDHIIEKCTIRKTSVSSQHFHQIRQVLLNKSGAKIDYVTRNGVEYSQHKCVPFKLEFSMTKRVWSLLWLKIDFVSPEDFFLMTTPVCCIRRITPDKSIRYDNYLKHIECLMRFNYSTILIRLEPEYQEEMQRIFYAFSCFKKEVKYDPNDYSYQIKVFFQKAETDYILSKIRFLGRRIKVLEPESIIERLKETSQNALKRYNIR